MGKTDKDEASDEQLDDAEVDEVADIADEEPEDLTDDTTDETTDEPVVAVDDQVDEIADEPEDRGAAPEVIIEKRGGASATIAWLALFLSLVTVAGVGYLYMEKLRDQRSASQEGDAVAALSGRLDETSQSIDNLDASVSDIAAAESRSNAMIESLQRELDDRAALFDSLPPRMTSLEQSVAAIQGVSVDARNTYLIAEAEYYMQIANAQLQLAGNAYLASLALSQADDRLLQLADPALTDVRRAVADEIAALDVMEKPDVAGVSLTLASLARVVDSLPLRQPAEAEQSVDEASEDEQGGASRAWGAVKGAVAGLVKHTPPSDDSAPLLTPDAEPLIRSNLSLQLQAARLALLRGEQSIFEQSLDDADAWLDAYFDTSSEPVGSARETIAEIRDGYSASAAPDISGSLRLLRQYKTLAESGE